MIIDWQGIYYNSEYYSANMYNYNGIVKYGAVVPISTAADGVYFYIDLGGNLIYLKRVG